MSYPLVISVGERISTVPQVKLKVKQFVQTQLISASALESLGSVIPAEIQQLTFYEAQWSHMSHVEQFDELVREKGLKFADPLTLISCMLNNPRQIHRFWSFGTAWFDENKGVYMYASFTSVNAYSEIVLAIDEWSKGLKEFEKWWWTPLIPI